MSFFELDSFKALGSAFMVGLTEFLPVSVAGHLLLAERLGGLDPRDFGAAFLPLVELAALAALLSAYGLRVWRTVSGMTRDPAARRLVLGLAIASVPAAVVGLLAHDFIHAALFNVWIICFALIVGGGMLLWADHLGRAPRYHAAAELPLAACLLIALAQCVALVPGVSRSAASIVAALLIGADRRAAADYSLWLAMPMLAGTLACDVYRSPVALSSMSMVAVATGFAASFLAAWCVVRTLPDFAARNGYALFAWWRVILGSLGLIALALGL